MKKNKHAGAMNELQACLHLLEDGYEVFKNVSPVGEIDIIAIKNGVIKLLDVKPGVVKSDGTATGMSLKNNQLALGIRALHVYKDGTPYRVEDLSDEEVELLGVRICQRCQKSFKGRFSNRTYCSLECAEIVHKEILARKMERIRKRDGKKNIARRTTLDDLGL